QQKGLLSFGGPYSNHIHALAYAGHVLGIPTVGIVRGYPHYLQNPTLTDAARWGMQLKLVDKRTYAQRHDSAYLKQCLQDFPQHLVVPEGGSDSFGVAGAARIWQLPALSEVLPDYLVVPVGSGGTFAGLISAAPKQVKVLGISVLNAELDLSDRVTELVNTQSHSVNAKWQLDRAGHCGGYGKTTPELMKFIADFAAKYHISLDPVYTGKMMLRLHNLVKDGYFPKGANIAALHTGGLQGVRGFQS
ncbi:MAG: 1-aminocyclopropane-1-carboxylate deaminase/D-cysteine desulfhydrase, partial [Pontibacterium sp.]